jgi:hypothetical protein
VLPPPPRVAADAQAGGQEGGEGMTSRVELWLRGWLTKRRCRRFLKAEGS